MKRYKRIIKKLVQIDKASFEAFEKKLTFTPYSEEWKTLESFEGELDKLAMQEFAALKKCITWYRQRAKTADEIQLIVELKAEYDSLYEQMVCDLSDEEINEQVSEMLKSLISDTLKCEEISENQWILLLELWNEKETA